MTLKSAFQHSVGHEGAPLHFAAHSHHPWPDVTRAAHIQAWQDAANLLDRKWEKIFGEVIPEAKAHIASVLNLPDPNTITFAPNTHELLTRILSCLTQQRAIRVLTTDSEFHTFNRQMSRLEESDLAHVTRISAEPHQTFVERFCAGLKQASYDLVFFSDVFFNSGAWIKDAARIVQSIPNTETFVVIDGYHSFMAVPLDLSSIAHQAFYLAGGYKYAMAGEGACFLHCPPGFGPRPLNTGWYAEFAELANRKPGTVGYSTTGDRFAGATFDPSGLYRLNAVMSWLKSERQSVTQMLNQTHALQQFFVEQLRKKSHAIHENQLVVPLEQPARGRFLTFETPDAQAVQRQLLAAKIVTDARGNRLRIGFGIYHDGSDVNRLSTALEA